MIIRSIKHNGEVYLNAQDVINKIKDHKEALDDRDRGYVGAAYGLAHDHIIDIIKIYIRRA